MAVNLHTTHFRFGVDELAESTHGWYANEDTNPSQGTIPLDTVFLLRFTVQETGGTAAANTDNTFQFQINGGSWAALTTTSVGPRAVAAAAFTNGAACTKRLSGTGTFESSGAGCTEDGTSGGTANDIAASGNSETECGIIIDAADVVHGDSIAFRLISPDFPITNDVVPTVVVNEPANQTLVATAPLVTVSAPAASRLATLTLTAATVLLTLTAPLATVTQGGALQAGIPVVTLSAPTATRVAQIALAGGVPVMTLSAPSATRATAVTVTATAPTFAFAAPTATIPSDDAGEWWCGLSGLSSLTGGGSLYCGADD